MCVRESFVGVENKTGTTVFVDLKEVLNTELYTCSVHNYINISYSDVSKQLNCAFTA